MKLAKGMILFLLVIGSVYFLQAEEVPLASKQLIQALQNEVSGEIAFNYTVMISMYDRIQSGEGWNAAARMIQQELKRIGYQDITLEGWPSNGSRYYYTYRTPIGWRAKKAELWITSPQQKRLCSYAEIPLTLVKHSNAADVSAELIDVGTGLGEDSYVGKEVKGKIVLATAYTGDVMREAVMKRGALGVVTWYPPEVRPGYPNMIRYTAIWPTWEERNQVGFGFNVSKNQGWLLKKMLAEGKKVVLDAKVEAEYYDSQVEVLSAAIPGTIEPDKEVLIIGHLCHPLPSANDNASGSGGMLEMARALKAMIDKGLIESPARTIRFLWVPEFAGTYPYIKAHLKRTRNTLAVINCDMIGEDLHLTGGTFNITCTPDSMPSYLNDVVANFTRLTDSLNLSSINGSDHPFAYRIKPYSGGSDHLIFNDSALKVPAVMFGHGDRFHHTSLDTPDKVDSSELRRVCFITLGAMYYMANADRDQSLDMAHLIARNGIVRLAEDYYDSLHALQHADSLETLIGSYQQLKNVIYHSALRETVAIKSVNKFTNKPGSFPELDAVADNINALSLIMKKESARIYKERCQKLSMFPRETKKTPFDLKLERLIPVRSKDFIGPLQTDYLVAKLGEEVLDKISLTGNIAYETLNFVDGKRSISEIGRAVSAEYGPVFGHDIFTFFQTLQEAGLITLESR